MDVSKQRLEVVVRILSTFTTRNTLSPDCWQAAEWVAGQLGSLPGMQVEKMVYRLPKGPRVPEEVDAVQVVATLPGESEDCIIVGAHMDSLVLGTDPKTGRAPGANDNATGVAVVLEMARLLSGTPHRNTLKFVAFTGEEQGLLGSQALVERARDERWPVAAVINVDTVGSPSEHAYRASRQAVRIFSGEGAGAEGSPHPSRELARFIEYCARPLRGFRVRLVYRKDRFGRRGDHLPFAAEGIAGVRITETYEDFPRQHTVEDVADRIDWNYLRNVARVNWAVLQKLAEAGPPPTEVRYDPKQSYDTLLYWKGSGQFRVYWRDSASPVWEESLSVGSANEALIRGVNKDHCVFAVGAEGGVPVPAQ